MTRFKVFFILIAVGTAVWGAAGAAQTAPELEKSLAANPDKIEVREQLARVYLKQKNWNKVIEHMNPHTDVASPRGYLLLATAYQENKDFGNVVRVIRLLSEKKPKDYQLRFMLGDALLKQAAQSKDIRDRQRLETEGIESFRGAIRMKKTFRPPYQALVNFFLASGLNHEAREQINDMLRVFGQKGDLHADLCRLYALDGFLPQAIRHCQRARQLTPEFAESYVYLAQAYFDQKEMEKAESTLIEAAKRFPKSEFVQYGAGQFFLKKNNFPVAMKYLKRAVAGNADSGRSQLALAHSLFESGLAAESLPHYTKACQIDSSTQGELLGAASRLRLKGNPSLAAKFSQAAGGCKRP